MHAILALLLLAQIPNLPAQNGTVTGELRTASGTPAAGVRVTAVVPPASADDEFKATAMVSIGETGADGRYRLEGIPAGRYYISAGRVDFPTYYPGSTILLESNIVTVPPGGTTAGINFVLKNESAGRAGASGFAITTVGFHIPISIRVEGGGRVPVFQNGIYPVLRFTRLNSVPNLPPIESLFSAASVALPIPTSSQGDEYTVTVNDLQDYVVKSITYGSIDLRKETLKVQRQIVATPQSNIFTFTTGARAVSGSQLTLTLEPPPATQTPAGTRVTGRSVGAGDEIYLSGVPGVLYSDGTFEFHSVASGLHKITKFLGNTLTAAAVSVGDRDVDGVVLRQPQILPIDFFEAPPKLQSGSLPESKAFSLPSIAGRVLDETSQEALYQGAVTIEGYRNTRRTFAIVGGSYAIPDLLPGSYNLTINVYGYMEAKQPVTVGAEGLKLDLIARKEIQ